MGEGGGYTGLCVGVYKGRVCGFVGMCKRLCDSMSVCLSVYGFEREEEREKKMSDS